MGDTLLVANSGGTDISYVNLNGGGSGREVFRYALPNLVAFTVTSTKSSAGFTIQQRTRYDFSDRPQFIGSTCTGNGPDCGDVVVTYSTTPTPGQSEPFSKKNGTLRWENLTKGKSHFYFEQAIGQGQDRADTLEVIRYDAKHWGRDGRSFLISSRRPRVARRSNTPWSFDCRISLSGIPRLFGTPATSGAQPTEKAGW
jgi:hypothetical protein